MREIKFRAWDRDEKKMFSVMEMRAHGDNGVFNRTAKAFLDGRWGMRPRNAERGIAWNGEWRDNIEIMQYTGLKDKNGKEIYEGDIVTIWFRDIHSDSHKYSKRETFTDRNGKEEIGEVYFDDQDFSWRAKCNGSFCPTFMRSDRNRFFEVIGNIYESPDLLK